MYTSLELHDGLSFYLMSSYLSMFPCSVFLTLNMYGPKLYAPLVSIYPDKGLAQVAMFYSFTNFKFEDYNPSELLPVK
jgi:hypothetical protein